jgi:hypothetical protein
MVKLMLCLDCFVANETRKDLPKSGLDAAHICIDDSLAEDAGYSGADRWRKEYEELVAMRG